jgi:opine dehydrogenase
MSNCTSPVTVIGSGNAGLTAAYHLSRNGCDVCLYGSPGFDQPLDDIQQRSGIEALPELSGVPLAFSGFTPIHTLSRDIAEAIAFADILLMPVPSFAQEVLFDTMLPYLTNRHMLVMMPGNYGSLTLKKRMRDQGYHHLDPTIVDTISIPWACRINGPAQIAIMGIKEFLPMAALPASSTGAAIASLQGILPLPMKPLKNVIAAGLENINFGGHPLLTTLNIGLLENFCGNFNYYKDCCSPSTARAVAVMEQERLAVGDALGIELTPELEAMNALYRTNFESVYEFNRSSETHGKITSAPDSANHRYITEDASYLLVPCHEFGRLAQVPTPVVDACLVIDNAYNQTDYFQEGRTLEKMGIAGMTIDQIMAYVA